MKNIALVVLALMGLFRTHAQEAVSWETSVKKLSENEYHLIAKATIKEGWHLYSQRKTEAEIAPFPTEFQFTKEIAAYKRIGSMRESTPIKKYDRVFDTELYFFDGSATFTQPIELLKAGTKAIFVTVVYQACDDKQCIYREEELGFSLDGNPVAFESETVDNESLQQAAKLELPLKNGELLTDVAGSDKKDGAFLRIFILGFLGGLLALLTPCVFPMIPLTVSFFTKHSQHPRKGVAYALLYGLCIVVIYLLLSLPFHFLDAVSPEILNTISTNMWLNVFFFLIFVFFAFSFFGYYEIRLPASWGNKMDSASHIGGFFGIFFMALTLAIVSFSCTGPILGSLLAGSLTADGGAMQLTVGMTGFGLALALPFALFALFPQWLRSLPKSGGWMNTAKVALGFLELALAFKFLSNADLVAHWGILKREIFIGIWIVVFALLAAYLFRLIRFPHDGPRKKMSFSRIAFGVLILAFVVYLLPGLQKSGTSRLQWLSGFPPPVFYSVYEQESDCPLGLKCFKDFEEGLQFAKEANKPILLDFTGWACVNCRKMEENVWSQPAIYTLLRENYVLVSLYVDDRKLLPAEEQFQYRRPNGTLKSIRTVGDKWATFQAVNFKTASQPYYILLSPDYELLQPPQQYTNAATYYQWLQKGLAEFESKRQPIERPF